jgi:peptidyl-tRNA hydrolase, PTH1 family
LADVLREQWGLPVFRREGAALSSAGRRGGDDVMLLKPQTYMNRSGATLRPLLEVPEFVPSSELLVVSDDFALPLGTFRLRARGSAGGHNGLRSIEETMGSQEYARLRIGIGPVPDDVEDRSEWVVAPFSRRELLELAGRLPDLADAVECWLEEGIEPAMNRFNRRGQESE